MTAENENKIVEDRKPGKTRQKLTGVPYGSEKTALDYLRSGKPVPPELVPPEGNTSLPEVHEDDSGGLLFPDLKLPTLLD